MGKRKCLAWDATTPDTFAASHLSATKDTAGAVAAHSAALKRHKYAEISATHIFMPLAVETLGVWEEEGLSFLKELGRRTSLLTGERRETVYLLQRLSVAVQRGMRPRYWERCRRLMNSHDSIFSNMNTSFTSNIFFVLINHYL